MTKPAFSKILFAFASALVLICVPKPAPARHNGGPHGGGGSHGGGSHGGGALRGGGHSSFKGNGHSYGGFGGGGRFSSARMDGGRMSVGPYARSGGFSSRPPSNFARNSNLGRGRFGTSVASRNFGHFGTSQPEMQNSRSTMGKWQSFGNSSNRPMLASTLTSRNAAGGGWRSFGNLDRGGGAEMSRGYGSNVRTDGQWHSFGNSRNASLERNSSGFSPFGRGRVTASNRHSSGLGFNSNRFSSNVPASTRFSSFSSFSSSRSMGNFGDSRFGSSNLGNSSFGHSGFSNSGIGSGVSLIPSLLGGFLNLGTSGFGGQGILAANALSLAVRLFVSAIGATDFGQGASAGGDFGFGQGGFGGNSGLESAPVWPACAPGAPFWPPRPASGVYCGPYAYQPFGWSSVDYLGDLRIGFSHQ
jgi:hypothetical protein